jgi:DNA-binding NarL/FixJ family response regulator
MKLSFIGITVAYWPLFFAMGLLLIVVFLYLRQKILQTKEKQQELIGKIAALEEKIAKQTTNTPTSKKKEPSLDKAKIEKTIDTKIGSSSWEILNLMNENLSISNKEIARQVSLSVEGVSSSLRRMYTSFGVKDANNKRIALVMKARNLSEAASAEEDA